MSGCLYRGWSLTVIVVSEWLSVQGWSVTVVVSDWVSVQGWSVTVVVSEWVSVQGWHCCGK